MPRVIVSAGHENIGLISPEKIGANSARTLRGSSGALGREAEWTIPWANELVALLSASGVEAVRTDAVYHPEVYGREADLVISGHCDGVNDRNRAQYCQAATVHAGPSTAGADNVADQFVAVWKAVYPAITKLPANGPVTDNMTQYYGGWYRGSRTPMVLIEHKILGAGGVWRDDGPTPREAAMADATAVLRFFGIEDRAHYQKLETEMMTPTGAKLERGFHTFWTSPEMQAEKLNIRLIGYPEADEFIASLPGYKPNTTYLVCQRLVLKWDPEEPYPFDIHACHDPEAQAARNYAKTNGLLKV